MRLLAECRRERTVAATERRQPAAGTRPRPATLFSNSHASAPTAAEVSLRRSHVIPRSQTAYSSSDQLSEWAMIQ